MENLYPICKYGPHASFVMTVKLFCFPKLMSFFLKKIRFLKSNLLTE